MKLDAEFLRLARVAARVYLLGIVGLTCIWICMITFLPKRRKGWPLFVWTFVKSFYAQIIVGIFLDHYYGTEEWMRYFVLANTIALLLFDCTLYYNFFQGDILKVLLGAVGSEMIGATVGQVDIMLVNLLEGREDILTFGGEIVWMDLLLIPIGAILFALIYLPMRSTIRRYRTYEIRYEKILWVLVACYILGTQVTYFIDVRDVQTVMYIWYLYLLVWVLAVLTVAVLFVRKSRNKLHAEHEYLLLQKDLMVSHYIVVQKQINRMEICQKMIDEQMREMEQVRAAAAGAAKFVKINEYLKHLQTEYDSIQAGIYCNDWMVDAVLYCQLERIRNQGGETECSCQGYERGSIAEQDLAQILYQLLERGNGIVEKETLKISFRMTAVTNQIFIVLSVLEGQEGKVGRRNPGFNWMKPYLKKYDGMVSMEGKGNRQKIRIILNNGGYEDE